jgi:hypothetical protein
MGRKRDKKNLAQRAKTALKAENKTFDNLTNELEMLMSSSSKMIEDPYSIPEVKKTGAKIEKKKIPSKKDLKKVERYKNIAEKLETRFENQLKKGQLKTKVKSVWT